jgi:threonine dehydratase
MKPSADAPPSEVTLADVRAAAERLRGVGNRTAVKTSRTLDAMVGARAHLKCENEQRVGAFKFRGASNALAKLREDASARGGPTPGVLTYSSGNHAQAIALAGRELGVATTIIMPSDAPAVKLEATRGYLGPGGEVVVYDRAETTREELGAKLAAERGLVIVPPYDHPDVIAGQGTAALELFEELESRGERLPDVLFVCCGGGGLLSGCAIAAKGLTGGRCVVVGVEPELADDATRSFYARELHTVKDPPTIADGARTPSLGRWTFPLVLRHVDHMLTVSEAEIVEAMRFCFERMKSVVEPSGALGLAGLMKAARGERTPGGSAIDVGGKTVGVIVSGGNTDLAQALGLIAR